MARQRRAYEQAVACCLTTPWAADSVIRDYGIAPAKVHVVGHRLQPRAPAGERDWSRPRFLFVGMDWARKNGAGVLRAFARLRERGARPRGSTWWAAIRALDAARRDRARRAPPERGRSSATGSSGCSARPPAS